MFFKRTTIGLDLGTHGLKVATSTGRKALQVLWQGEIMPARTQRDDAPTAEELQARVQALLAESGINLSSAVNSIVTGTGTIGKYLEFPPLSPKELNVAAPTAALRHIPYAADQINLSYMQVPALAEEKRSAVFFIADQKERSDGSLALLKACGVKVNRLEVPVLALVREFAANRPQQKDQVSALIHSGARLTHVIVLRERHPYFYREIALAGRDFTYAFQQGAQSSWAAAEAYKRDYDAMDREVPVEPFMQRWLNEIKRTISAFENQSPGLKVGRAYLSGGTAAFTNLHKRIEEQLGIPVEVDRWDGLKYDGKAPQNGPGAQYKLAAGLTLED